MTNNKPTAPDDGHAEVEKCAKDCQWLAFGQVDVPAAIERCSTCGKSREPGSGA